VERLVRSLNISPEGRTVFRFILAPVIEPRRRYVGMPKPLLNLGVVAAVASRRTHTKTVDLGANARLQAVFPALSLARLSDCKATNGIVSLCELFGIEFGALFGIVVPL
jgi:hypothetical protein